jgi:hypothetical protein
MMRKFIINKPVSDSSRAGASAAASGRREIEGFSLIELICRWLLPS